MNGSSSISHNIVIIVILLTLMRHELVTTCLGSTTSTSGSFMATLRMQVMSKPYTFSHPGNTESLRNNVFSVSLHKLQTRDIVSFFPTFVHCCRVDSWAAAVKQHWSGCLSQSFQSSLIYNPRAGPPVILEQFSCWQMKVTLYSGMICEHEPPLAWHILAALAESFHTLFIKLLKVACEQTSPSWPTRRELLERVGNLVVMNRSHTPGGFVISCICISRCPLKKGSVHLRVGLMTAGCSENTGVLQKATSNSV